jgi:hypothetical protein
MGKHASNFLELTTEVPEVPRIGRHRAPLPSGRRRADTELLPVVVETDLVEALDPANTSGLRLRPVRRPPLRRRMAGVAGATTALMMVGGMAGVGTYLSDSDSVDTESNRVVAANDAVLVPVEVDVSTVPAPVVSVEAEPVPDVAAEPVALPVPAPVLPPPAPVVPKTVPAAPVVPPAPAPVVPPVPVLPPKAPAGLKAPLISASARSQLGVFQDCTMLVTNSLRSVGISFHDWPAGYLSLGPTVTAAEAVPGDLVYYVNGGLGVAHIAVYDGAGMAIHGGWNGNQTVRASVYVGSGPVFIRVM